MTLKLSISKYIIIIRISYNGSLTNGERGRRRSKYLLHKRSFPNGIRKSIQYVVREPQSSKVKQSINHMMMI